MMRTWVSLVAACAACTPEYEPCSDVHDETPITCERYPHLCDAPFERILNLPDHAHAYDLVFVPDGFTADELPEFRRRVMDLVDGLRDDANGIVALAPRGFNYYRLDIASSSGDLYNRDRDDSAFGGCLRDDALGVSASPFLSARDDLARFAVAHSIPDVPADAVIVIANERWSRANASFDGIVHLGLDEDAGVLTHELGHALFDLRDEYAEADECFADTSHRYAVTVGNDDLFESPNLSMDPRGRKWAGLVDGAREGGARRTSCVYHPTDSCRMLRSSDSHFCPVCLDHVRRQMAAHLRDENDGPPQLALGLDAAIASTTFLAKCRDANTPMTITVAIDGDSWPSIPLPAQPVVGLEGWASPTPGAHVLYAVCRDAHGITTRAELPFVVAR